jgi:hypothetical protein
MMTLLPQHADGPLRHFLDVNIGSKVRQFPYPGKRRYIRRQLVS